jgi:hypothetical protein
MLALRGATNCGCSAHLQLYVLVGVFTCISYGGGLGARALDVVAPARSARHVWRLCNGGRVAGWSAPSLLRLCATKHLWMAVPYAYPLLSHADGCAMLDERPEGGTDSVARTRTTKHVWMAVQWWMRGRRAAVSAASFSPGVVLCGRWTRGGGAGLGCALSGLHGRVFSRVVWALGLWPLCDHCTTGLADWLLCSCIMLWWRDGCCTAHVHASCIVSCRPCFSCSRHSQNTLWALG